MHVTTTEVRQTKLWQRHQSYRMARPLRIHTVGAETIECVRLEIGANCRDTSPIPWDDADCHAWRRKCRRLERRYRPTCRPDDRRRWVEVTRRQCSLSPWSTILLKGSWTSSRKDFWSVRWRRCTRVGWLKNDGARGGGKRAENDHRWFLIDDAHAESQQQSVAWHCTDRRQATLSRNRTAPLHTEEATALTVKTVTIRNIALTGGGDVTKASALPKYWTYVTLRSLNDSSSGEVVSWERWRQLGHWRYDHCQHYSVTVVLVIAALQSSLRLPVIPFAVCLSVFECKVSIVLYCRPIV